MDILQDQDCKKLVRENLPEMQINHFFCDIVMLQLIILKIVLLKES